MQANSQCRNYSTFIWPFEYRNWEGWEKNTKNAYLKNEKSFLDEMKTIFHNF